MLFRKTFLLSLLASVLGAPLEVREDEIYDAVIVGGGPSGLAALSALARVRRKVILLDSADYRNAATRVMHDVLGFDGMPLPFPRILPPLTSPGVTPAYYRYVARQQIAFYNTISMRNGTVSKIEPKGTPDRSLFAVTADFLPDDGVRTVLARKVVLGTGMRDIVPTGTPGVLEAWGKGIYWCPWCDGHEHADQPLGLFGSLEKIPSLVREILTLNKDIIAFTNGTNTAETRAKAEDDFPQWQRYLRIHNVTVNDNPLSALVRLRNGTDGTEDPSLPSVTDHDLFRVEFAGGAKPIERAAFLVSWPVVQASSLGTDTGVWQWGQKLAVNQTDGHMTNVPGLYAVGDANSDNSTNVPHALYSGKSAGVYLHSECLPLSFVDPRHG